MIIAAILLKNRNGEFSVDASEQRKQGLHIEATPVFRKKLNNVRENRAIPHIEIQRKKTNIDLDIPRLCKRVMLVHPICARESTRKRVRAQ